MALTCVLCVGRITIWADSNVFERVYEMNADFMRNLVHQGQKHVDDVEDGKDPNERGVDVSPAPTGAPTAAAKDQEICLNSKNVNGQSKNFCSQVCGTSGSSGSCDAFTDGDYTCSCMGCNGCPQNEDDCAKIIGCEWQDDKACSTLNADTGNGVKWNDVMKGYNVMGDSPPDVHDNPQPASL